MERNIKFSSVRQLQGCGVGASKCAKCGVGDNFREVKLPGHSLAVPEVTIMSSDSAYTSVVVVDSEAPLINSTSNTTANSKVTLSHVRTFNEMDL